MPEEVTGTAATETSPALEQQPSGDEQLKQNMSLALGGFMPNQTQVAPTTQETTTTETTETAPTEVTTTVTEQTPSFDFSTFSQKFGYQNPEDAIKEIEELRAWKENPIEEIELPNEESKKLYEYIKKGDLKKATQILNKKFEIEDYLSQEVSDDNAENIIKLGMKVKRPDLSDKEINYRFNKQFGLPKEPIQRVDESEDDFQERLNEWKEKIEDIKMDKVIEAKMAKSDLETHKSTLELPDIEEEVNPEFQNFLEQKKNQENLQKINEQTIQAYKSLTPKSVEKKINFNDEPNKINFDFTYEPSAEDFNKNVEIATNFDELFFPLFIGKDGKPDREKLLRVIDFARNEDKVLTEAIKQSKNATLKAGLSKPPVNGQRLAPQTQQQGTDLDAAMQIALNGWRRN